MRVEILVLQRSISRFYPAVASPPTARRPFPSNAPGRTSSSTAAPDA
jgi:hypothetical protein